MFFRYKARGQDGSIHSDILQAVDENDAIKKIASQNQLLLLLEPVTHVEPNKTWLLFASKVKHESLAMFCRQMYSLSKAGVSLFHAVKGLSENCSDPLLKKALIGLEQDLIKGHKLSDALVNYPLVFNDLFIAMVKVGETTGNLDKVMLQLSKHFDAEIETTRRLSNAFRYPSIVLSLLVFALLFINYKVIPVFADLYQRFDAKLPLITQVIIKTSNFMLQYWWLFALFCALFTTSFILWKNNATGRFYWDKCRLHIPILGDLVHRTLMARFAHTFGMMLKAGVSINHALFLAGKALDNEFLIKKVIQIKTRVEAGMSLSRASKKDDFFTPLVMQMILVGEETGQLDQLLLEVGDFYGREVDYDLKRLTAKIEPILIILVGIILLIFALGVLTPIWNLIDIIRVN